MLHYQICSRKKIFLKILRGGDHPLKYYTTYKHYTTSYAHFSQCNTVDKEKDLTKTCQFCVVQKFLIS